MLTAIWFIVNGVSALMNVARGEIGFALFGSIGFAFGLLTFLLLSPNPAGRPTRFRTATIVWHWIVMAFTVLFGGRLLISAALGQVWVGTSRTHLVLFYALFLAFPVWVTWRTIRMLRSDGREEAETATITGGLPIPPGPGGIAP